jgi:hypothetical protein
MVALTDLEDQGLHVRMDGTRLLVGPREKLTVEIIEFVKVNREWLLSLAFGRAIIQARSDNWIDPVPDICGKCGAPAIGYSAAVKKACAEHLAGGCHW